MAAERRPAAACGDVGRSSKPLPAGATIAPGYTALAHLNRGSALDVYDAWSKERACRCIAKIARPDRTADPEVRRRLRREGRMLLELSHPHIVRAYELLERPQPVLILETLTGETLAHLIESRRRRLPLADLAQLGLQLCSALHYLHGRGILHLDLKPSNIVAERGHAKVLDLSIARPPGRSHAGEGTPAYMAPEQARGGRLTPATDVWGLGLTLYEAASGHCPFDTADGRQRYEQLGQRAPALRRLRGLPASLATTLDACLDPGPAPRPALAELAIALEACVNGGASDPGSANARAAVAWKPSRSPSASGVKG